MGMTRRQPALHIAWMTISYRGVVLAVAVLVLMVIAGVWLLAPGVQSRQAVLAAFNHYVLGVPRSNGSPPAESIAQQAHFTALEGVVRVKKANGNTWVMANYNLPLEKGDVAQTGAQGIAKLSFSDGSNYTVMPDSLIVIDENVTTAQQRSQVSVRVTTGTVDLATGVYTEGSTSQVMLAGATASFAPQSKATVLNLPQADRHEILLKKGSGVVTRNQEKVTLGDYEKVSFASSSPAMIRTQEIAPPTLLSPPHLAGIKGGTRGQTVEFSWTATPDSRDYRLRLSANPYFSSMVIDRRVPETSWKIRGLKPGTYYWVVTSENLEGRESVESDRNQFTIGPEVAGGNLALELQSFVQHGQVLEIKGRTAPNAWVTVNGQVVGDMRADGSFTYFTPPLAVGENVIIVTAVNPQGKVNSVQKKLMIQ